MKLEFNIISIIITLGIIQGFLLSIAVLSIKKGNIKANRILGLFIFNTSICIFGGIFYKTNLYYYLPHLARINEPFRLLGAPLLYLYVRNLTSYNYKFKKIDILHFLPFVCNLLYLLPFYLKNSQTKINFISDQLIEKSDILLSSNQLFLVIMIIQVFIYLIAIRLIIKNHEYKIKDNFSSIDKINLSWLKSATTIYFILSLIIIFTLTYSFFMNNKNHYIYRLIPLAVSITLYALAYRGLIQPQIFTNELIINSGNNKKKYEKSNLTKQESEKYYKSLLQLMESDKPYLNQNLTLTELSVQLNIPLRYLSQVINEYTGNNFYSFINIYRVNEVKKYLVDPGKKNFSILDLAFDAGFNSKATFNYVFKMFTNMTPTEYKESLK